MTPWYGCKDGVPPAVRPRAHCVQHGVIFGASIPIRASLRDLRARPWALPAQLVLAALGFLGRWFRLWMEHLGGLSLNADLGGSA